MAGNIKTNIKNAGKRVLAAMQDNSTTHSRKMEALNNKVDRQTKTIRDITQAMGKDPVAKNLARDSLKASGARKKRIKGLSENPLKKK